MASLFTATAAATAVALALAAGTLSAGQARAATLEEYLRFTPSSSSDVVGYVVHVGDAPGFYHAGGGVAVDIGSSYQLVDGVGHVPLADVIDGSAHIVMRAYDSEGLYSVPSNELYVQIDPVPSPDCYADADCSDGDACNGTERCDAGVCTVGQALACADPAPCQVGWCDATIGCTSGPAADGTTCNDGNASTTGDVCQAGTCVGFTPTPDPEPTPDPDPAPDPSDDTFLLYDDFEGHSIRSQPSDWIVTDASGEPVCCKYEVAATDDGGRAMALPWTVENFYFAHAASPEAADWSAYEYMGRLRIDDARGGIGATIVSGHPGAADYVALYRDAAQPSFALSFVPDHDALVCAAGPDTGHVPEAGAWTVFRLRAIPEADGLRLQAKVWDERDQEPGEWGIDCLAEGRASVTGRPGLIANGWEMKRYDDLGVWRIDSSTGGSGHGETLFSEDFDAHTGDADLEGWMDSLPSGPVVDDGMLFRVERVGRNNRAVFARGMRQEAVTEIEGGLSWTDYEATGQVLPLGAGGGHGMLIYGQRSTGGGAIALRNTGPGGSYAVDVLGVPGAVCEGSAYTGVRSMSSVWHHFRLRATAAGSGVRVLARIWRAGETEPATWQADCLTREAGSPRSGSFGLWIDGQDAVAWDRIEVREIGAP